MLESRQAQASATHSTDVDLLEREIRLARSEPQGALVLLHGRGGDQFGFLPLLDELDPEHRLVVVTPRAPLELSSGGWQWYVSRGAGSPDRGTFLDSYARAAAWLDALPELIGVPFSRTVLGGFSMGAVMAYALGLGIDRPAPAAVLALSGFLPTVEGFELDLTERKGFPVAIGHGTQDSVVSVDFARQARRRLEDEGLAVTYRESPMAHSIDPNYLHDLTRWVKDVGGQLRARAKGASQNSQNRPEQSPNDRAHGSRN